LPGGGISTPALTKYLLRCHEVIYKGLAAPIAADYIGGFTHGKKQVVLASAFRW
jgi:hypothetical protein